MSFFKELSNSFKEGFSQELGMDTPKGPQRIVLVGSQEQENEIRNLHLTTFHGRDDLEVYSRVNLPGTIEENQALQHQRPAVLHPVEGTEDYDRAHEFELIVSDKLGQIARDAAQLIVVNRQPDGQAHSINEPIAGDITDGDYAILMNNFRDRAFVREIPSCSPFAVMSREEQIIPDGDVNAYIQEHWPRPQQKD
ncbi:MAG TPA: hypothetical protein VHT70_05020 [Candidatus Saccharimonadales bacterium]|jgi:hypothetical protein|nr:hypothetical protein [Candidatus Saccharimonadales bacterium]